MHSRNEPANHPHLYHPLWIDEEGEPIFWYNDLWPMIMERAINHAPANQPTNQPSSPTFNTHRLVPCPPPACLRWWFLPRPSTTNFRWPSLEALPSPSDSNRPSMLFSQQWRRRLNDLSIIFTQQAASSPTPTLLVLLHKENFSCTFPIRFPIWLYYYWTPFFLTSIPYSLPLHPNDMVWLRFLSPVSWEYQFPWLVHT